MVQGADNGFGTELLELNTVIYLCNDHINLTIQQSEKCGVQTHGNRKKIVQQLHELQRFSSECLNTNNREI